MDFDKHQTICRAGLNQRILKFTFRVNIKTQAASEYVHELVVAPGSDIVVGTIHDHALYGIAVIIDETDDGLEAVADDRREVLAGHLEHRPPQTAPQAGVAPPWLHPAWRLPYSLSIRKMSAR